MVYYFQVYRDGITNLNVVSTCDGVFTFKYKKYAAIVKSESAIEQDKIEEDRKHAHYSTYTKLNIDGNILINETEFKKYTFYNSESRILQCLLDRINATKCEPFSISNKYDVLYGLTIQSKKTECTILMNDQAIFRFEVSEGSHYYLVFLIMFARIYCKISIKFSDDCINRSRYDIRLIYSIRFCQK